MNEMKPLHRHLIGRPGSRGMLNTPALVIELDVLDRNIVTMATFAATSGVSLRPHAKSHKSVDLARRQIDAGAVGVCCAKLGEAEALAAGGIDDLLITSPIVTPQAIERLIKLNATVPTLAVVTDHPRNAAELGAAAAATGRALRVLVDVDPGVHRTGVASPEAAVHLAQTIMRWPALRYMGIQFYCGTLQHIPGYAERSAAVSGRVSYLREVIDALDNVELFPGIITGGGTGTHRIDAACGVMTELQPGSYVFMDRQYSACELDETVGLMYGQSLQIDTRVISANRVGQATIDAGLKAMATDAGPPTILRGTSPDASLTFMGDEHGLITAPNGGSPPELGALITLIPPHCDPTTNLYDYYHIVRGDVLIDIWPVTARGRSQ